MREAGRTQMLSISLKNFLGEEDSRQATIFNQTFESFIELLCIYF